MTAMIQIDLQKTSDMTDHGILLRKMSAIGFSNHTTGWFKGMIPFKSIV